MTTSCIQCKKTPAKFTLREEPYCAEDYAKFAHPENVLRIAQETVNEISRGACAILERSASEGKGRFLLTGPDLTIADDSLDVLIVQAETCVQQRTDPPEEPIF